METIQLFTDGSCIGNPGPGGWAAIIKVGCTETLLQGGAPQTTNNRMEMTAIIEGMRNIPSPSKINIVSDSKYVIDAFRQNWISNWQRSGWRTAAKQPVKNQDLWELLIDLLAPHTITWEWVKGHNGHRENEIVDATAQAQARSFA